ncbi:MAG TPA: fumarate hydratase [Deltaproteobacteria bacterium]|nr:fumarate hydratase [Deltaproteobacteria bacterium]
MREINSDVIRQAVSELAIGAAHDLEPDILDALLAARDRETAPLAKNIIELLLTNADIASRERVPVCQDTGTCIVFVSLGQDVHVIGDLQAAIQEGVRIGYDEGFLRKSVCDPLTRKNTGTNTPAVVHFDIVAGDKIKISFLPKGCGSENMSALAMLPPSAGIEGMVRYVIERVVAAGSNPCPPVVVGVGVGGNFEKVALLAKKALLREVGQASERAEVAELEQRLLGEINRQGQGVHGLGGINTALAVHIETFPSHIASLPVAVNIQCHAHRHKEIIL